MFQEYIYRIKGIIEIEHMPTKVVLQSVRDNLILTDGTPWGNEKERKSQIVFIGRELEKESIQRLLEKNLVV